MPTSSNNSRRTASQYIPYSYPADEYTCGTDDGDLVRTIQLAGVPFETMPNEDINGLERQFFSAVNSIGTKYRNVALWSHVVRRKLRYDLSGIEYDNFFSRELNRQYGDRIADKDYYTNELYLSPVFRTTPTIADRIAKRLSKDEDQKKAALAASKVELDKITGQLMIALRRYHPTLLGTRESEDEGFESDYANFYARILNGGTSGPVNVRYSPVRYAIQRTDLDFHHEIVEIQSALRSRFVGLLGMKAPYSIERVRADIMDGLLSVPCEFVLSQSLTFTPTNKAAKFLERQLGQIQSTSGNELMVEELKATKKRLENGTWSMGEHEFILAVYGDTVAELNKSISEVEVALQNKQIEVVRENSGTLISQYFSMLPGNFRMNRIRAMPIGLDNFSKFFPMHNFPIGNPQGSQWGMPLAMFETTSGAPYFFNYHVSRNALKEQGVQLEYFDEADKEESVEGGDTNKKTQRKESGNYQVIGANGAGKTVVQGLIRSLSRKTKMNGARPYKSFTFDKDFGQELAIRAAGGAYFPFEAGKHAGINPFSLPDNQRSRLFIANIAIWCARQDETYVFSGGDEEQLKRAIDDVYNLGAQKRRFARILDTLEKGKGTLHSALTRWVEDGLYAWVLDSKEDRFDLDHHNDFGFDITQLLPINEARTPILSYIVHKIDTSAAGSPHSVDIDEASNALKDPFLLRLIDDKARTIRKLDGVIGLSFQNAKDASSGPIAATLENQFPTRFIFPNSSAARADYIDGLKLTEKEFLLVREGMGNKPGTFLLKQGNESCVVTADLSGMNDMLAVLSGSEDNLVIARRIIGELGNDPEVWLPEFWKRRA